MIAVVDYGMGNSAAIVNMLDYLGFDAVLTRDRAAIGRASRLVLPGVGAFDRAMRSLRALELVPALEDAVLGRRTPILGVCLGMQLLGRSSEEGGGTERGLGWLAADTVRLAPPPNSHLKLPHIGWSDVTPTVGSRLFARSGGAPRYYFVHSFLVRCDDAADVAAVARYGIQFCCAVSRDNVHGVQFHPEKSHRHGMELLRCFVEGE